MKFSNQIAYKSIGQFEFELPDFAIFTGKNGSGKSQLLSMLYTAFIQSKKPGDETIPVPEIDFKSLSNGQIGFFCDLVKLENLEKVGISDLQSQAIDIDSMYQYFRAFREWDKDSSLIYSDSHASLFVDIENVLEKKLDEITVDDFKKFFFGKYISHNCMEQLGNTKLPLRFYNYHIQSIQSKLDGISDEEFSLLAGEPPWVLINKIFEEIGLGFYFNNPKDLKFDQKFQLSLINRLGEHIKFSDLSSGEGVLVSLVLWAFNSEDCRFFPKVLILDEPDSHLHPEMSAQLLRVLFEILHKKFGVKVYMTTHSPSTVALAEEGTLYEVNNQSDRLVVPIKKDTALEILTEFVPNLSIDYKNHKQVFCESPTDVKYYQAIHNKFLAENPSSYKYYFIANSAGKGNCSQVYNIVDQIRGFGNSTCFGIVDYDNSNKQTYATKVHGFSERWAVENFILDPFYIIGLLYDLKKYHEVEQFGLGEHYNYFSIGDETNEKLQEVADRYFELFENKYLGYKTQKDLYEVEYYNGKKVKFPVWFLMEKSHGLEPKIKEVFTSLGSRYPDPKGAKLQLAVIDILATCYPFVPKTTVGFLKTLGDL